MAKTLLAWIGNTDLAAAQGKLKDGLGPIGGAVEQLDFHSIELLSSQKRASDNLFVEWLASQTKAKISTTSVSLTSPTNFEEIYTAANKKLNELRSDSASQVVIHVSPGTPAMAAVWIILAKTHHPCELIESSREEGVKTVSFPFEISAEFLPQPKILDTDEIVKLTQGLPPEAPEFGEIIHRSKEMKTIIAQARRLAIHDVPVLVQGESGTGKELFSRAIHGSSERKKTGAFIEVNCGAIPEQLIESTLFGHEKNAFTGATTKHVGHLENADKGTLFLDEIGELPREAQVKLLRALQQKSIQRVGSSKVIKTDFRLVAATNRNLIENVASGGFREDLFHRIAVGVLRLPPLRERTGDINLLVDFALERINKVSEDKPGWMPKKLSAGARNLLNQHTWPGNVRELINTIARAAIWAVDETIQTEEIRQSLFSVENHAANRETILNKPLGNGFDLQGVLSEVARHYMKRAMDETKGNKTAAKDLVGLKSATTLTNWMKTHGLEY